MQSDGDVISAGTPRTDLRLSLLALSVVQEVGGGAGKEVQTPSTGFYDILPSRRKVPESGARSVKEVLYRANVVIVTRTCQSLFSHRNRDN